MTLNISANNHVISLSGELDEKVNVSQISEVLNALQNATITQRVLIDFSQVKHANSCGIARWLKAINAVSYPIAYINAPVWLAEQFSFLGDFFAQDAIVLSFYANFYCPEIDENRTILLQIGKDIPLLESYEDYQFSIKIDNHVFEPDFEPELFLYFISKFLYPQREKYEKQE